MTKTLAIERYSQKINFAGDTIFAGEHEVKHALTLKSNNNIRRRILSCKTQTIQKILNHNARLADTKIARNKTDLEKPASSELVARRRATLDTVLHSD